MDYARERQMLADAIRECRRKGSPIRIEKQGRSGVMLEDLPGGLIGVVFFIAPKAKPSQISTGGNRFDGK